MAPGAPTGHPPSNRKTGLIVLISAIVVAVLVGSILLTLGLTRTGPFTSPGTANQATPTPTKAAIPAGFKRFTNQDHSFSVIYPAGWTVKDPLFASGVGKEFDGPASQVVQANHGSSSQSSDTGVSDDAFCITFGATTNGHSTVTIAGQQWTREECDSYGGLSSHAIVETVVYKGSLYLLSFVAPKNSFNSNRSQYFTPMEQSFTFLT